MARLLSMSEVAAQIGVSRGMVYKLIDQKRLRGFRVGRLWKFPPAEVERFIETSMQEEEEKCACAIDGG